MRLKLHVDLTEEQLAQRYDRTLLAIHSKFAKWLVGLKIPIVAYSIQWNAVDHDDDPHLFVFVDLIEDSPVEINSEFFDEVHLGGSGNG